MKGLGLGLSVTGRSASSLQLVMVTTANVTATDLGGNEYEFEKTAGADWTESARSTTAMTGDFLMSFQPRSSGVGNDAMLGVTTDPTASDHYNTIDYAIYFNGGTGVANYANGVSGANDIYAANEYVFIKRIGSTVTVYYGGTDATGATSSYPTFETAYTEAGVLYFDSSFGSVAGKKFRVKRLS